MNTVLMYSACRLPFIRQPCLLCKLSLLFNYDHASGVIILPDEDGWLEEDYVESDEVEDYGGTNGLDRSITESMLSADESSSREPTTEGGSTLNATSPLIGGGQRLSRYGTYFHHPERRRQVIPGAFPGR